MKIQRGPATVKEKNPVLTTVSKRNGKELGLMTLSQETCHKEVHFVLREIGGCLRSNNSLEIIMHCHAIFSFVEGVFLFEEVFHNGKYHSTNFQNSPDPLGTAA